MPWVWKDPRTSVLLPFWRAALGPRLAAVVVVRNPLEVAVSLSAATACPCRFGMALWERYNRLILAHSAGMPVLVTRYDDLVADPAGWSERARAFLAGVGMRLRGPTETPPTGRDFVDPGLRHSAHTRAEPLAGVAGGPLARLRRLGGRRRGPRARSCPPRSPPEPAVEAELDTVGPSRARLAPATVGARARWPSGHAGCRRRA